MPLAGALFGPVEGIVQLAVQSSSGAVNASTIALHTGLGAGDVVEAVHVLVSAGLLCVRGPGLRSVGDFDLRLRLGSVLAAAVQSSV